MNSSRLRSILAGGLLAAGLALSGCASTDSGTATVEAGAVQRGEHVDADTFRASLSDDVTILDVRTPQEFAEGHIAGTVNVDVSSPDFAQQVSELDPEGTYAVYCRSGNRSRTAMAAMQDAGLSDVFGLEGGIGALDPEDLVTD
ncbi:MAG: rhodanese-like domain-containing protein [Actinobacteria bacterium]|nr:rhodanese-like domain-containing protein [Actinomycetota bacterium]